MAAHEDTPAPDAPDAPTVDEEAGLVPKGETTTDDTAPDAEVVDSVGPAVESIDAPDPNAPPEPITPSTPLIAAQNRVAFENEVNAGAQEFANAARAAYIEARLAGQTIEFTVTTTED